MPARPSGYCFAHDEALAQTREAARSRGGTNKRNAARAGKLMPPELQALRGALFSTLADVRAGRLGAAQANAIANVSTAILRWYSVAEVEQRLAALEGREERTS
jgi:hypothetical protein